MNISRRFFLKGIALSGLASITLGRWGLSLANNKTAIPPAGPILVLISDEIECSAFLQGITETLPGQHPRVQRTDLGMSFVQDFNQLLSSRQPARIIGLVDDASAALIVELARASGSRMLWLGQHSASPGQARHRLLGDRTSSGLAVRLRNEEQWPAALGSALASRGEMRAHIARLNAVQPPLTGHFVSFAIET
jgi:hypothetical protein